MTIKHQIHLSVSRFPGFPLGNTCPGNAFIYLKSTGYRLPSKTVSHPFWEAKKPNKINSLPVSRLFLSTRERVSIGNAHLSLVFGGFGKWDKSHLKINPAQDKKFAQREVVDE
jgi:hypothetical protein